MIARRGVNTLVLVHRSELLKQWQERLLAFLGAEQGLTATPIRRDGQQPIIFMQCGPTRHVAARPAGAPQTLEVIPRYLTTPVRLAGDAGIQDVFRTLAGGAHAPRPSPMRWAAPVRRATRCWCWC